MTLQRQLLCTLVVVFLLTLLSQQTVGELLPTNDNTINNLYENLLQREYAGPVVFPNHQVERKAQRSPSLRLRFGRRSDPSEALLPSAEKRWFGDVNQKPIRSPSLRLRFGRRSDPAMPMHSGFDALMNNLASSDEQQNGLDYNDLYGFDGYERVVRKPQRLRWGRSVPYEADEEDNTQPQRSDDYLNFLLHAQKLRNLLMALNQYDVDTNAALSAEENSDDEFEREARKPGPLRLRWGRSTGGRSTVAAGASSSEKEVLQKKSLSPNVLKTEQPIKLSAIQNEHNKQ